MLTFLRKTTPLELAWVSLWLGTFSFTHRTAEESLSGTLDITNIQRFAFDGIALAILLLSITRIPKLQLNPITVFVIYSLFCIFSFTWSVSWIASLGKAGEVFLAALIVWIAMSGRNNLDQLLRLFHWIIILTGALLLYALSGYLLGLEGFQAISSGVIRHQITAPLISSNGISNLSAFLGLVMLAKFTMRKRDDPSRARYLLVYIACAALMIIAQGRTGMFVFVLGTLFIFLRKNPLFSMVFLPGVIIVIFLLGENLIFDLIMRGQNKQMFLSLTGRTILWEMAWEHFLNNPFFGVGFGTGSRYMFLGGIEGFKETISSVHNGFLEVLLGVGIIGFAIWIVALLWGCKLAVRSYRTGQNLDIAIGFIFVIVTTVMASGVGGWMNQAIGYFLVSTAYLSASAEASRRRTASAMAPSAMPGKGVDSHLEQGAAPAA